MLSIPLQTSQEPPATDPTLTESTESSTSSETTGSQTQNSEGGGASSSSQATRQDAAPKRLLTDDDIAGLTSAISGAVREAVPQGQQTQERQYTQEEMDQLLHVWKPDAKWYEKLAGGGDAGLQAAMEMKAGLEKQFNRRVQLEIAALKQELTPSLQGAAQAASAAAEERFYGANKDLNPHRDIVEMIYGALSKSGKLSGMSRPAMEKAVAEETRAWLKSKGVASTPANAGASRQNNGRKVPAQLNGTTSSGGSGGQSADSPTVAALKRIG